jgi:hypothetical protein
LWYTYPPIKHVGNGPELPNLNNATRKFQKKVAQDRQITIFDRQAEIFNGTSMEAVA